MTISLSFCDLKDDMRVIFHPFPAQPFSGGQEGWLYDSHKLTNPWPNSA